jgi:hypothetical protein
LIPVGKEDGYIYPIFFLTPSELETPVLRNSDKHLQELLQKASPHPTDGTPEPNPSDGRSYYH